MIRQYLTYRGREGYWMWILHRATGIGILLFLLLHVADTFLVFWPGVYDALTALYRHVAFRIGEVLLVGIVTFHAINGVRIMVVDFWSEATARRRHLFYATLALFALLFIPALILMVQAMLR